MNPGDRVGAYVLGRPLGKGAGGSAWAAERDGGGEVALKILDVGEAAGWGNVDQLRREAAALRELSHPGIPRLLDDFEDESGGRVRLVLAMELIPGKDLERAVDEGRRFSDAEVEQILAGLADILAYLGSLRPPVAHRDVSPKNVVLKPDGGVALVDFSCAQHPLRGAAGRGATLVGTAGYIPIEQVAGKATHKSDLYAAAATALFLLAGRNPAELPAKGLKPDLGAIGPISGKLECVLGRWLEPDEARRSLGAAEAASILRGETPVPAPPAVDVRPGPEEDFEARGRSRAVRIPLRTLPSDSRVIISRNDSALRVTIPPAGLSSPSSLGLGGFALFWLGFVAFWTFSAIAMGAPFFFCMFSLPFWAVGIFLARTALSGALGSLEISLDGADGFSWRESVLGRGPTRRWPLSDIDGISLEKASIRASGSDAKELVIEAGATRLRVGRGLTDRELLAIKDAMEGWLGRAVKDEAPLPNMLARD